jgi:hypothetical protein
MMRTRYSTAMQEELKKAMRAGRCNQVRGVTTAHTEWEGT